MTQILHPGQAVPVVRLSHNIWARIMKFPHSGQMQPAITHTQAAAQTLPWSRFLPPPVSLLCSECLGLAWHRMMRDRSEGLGPSVRRPWPTRVLTPAQLWDLSREKIVVSDVSRIPRVPITAEQFEAGDALITDINWCHSQMLSFYSISQQRW